MGQVSHYHVWVCYRHNVTLFWLCACVWTCLCLSVSVSLSLSLCGVEVTRSIFPSLSNSFSETGSLTEQGVHWIWLPWVASKYQESSCLCLPSAGFQSPPCLYLGFWGSNLSPHAFSEIKTKLPPQPDTMYGTLVTVLYMSVLTTWWWLAFIIQFLIEGWIRKVHSPSLWVWLSVFCFVF